MGNLKKLLSNKNVVTLLGAILIVVVLYLFFNWRVNSAIQPVSIPYALHSIEAQTLITRDDIATVEVSQSSLRGNVTYSAAEVSGKYTTSFIPSGGFFYKDANYSEVGSLPNKYLYENIREDLIAFNFRVNVKTSFGNSFFPGIYFDIYLRIELDQAAKKVLYGKLVSNLKVAAVRNANGKDVFAASNEVRTPTQIIFGVDEETNVLLRGVEKLISDSSDKKIEIILVPNVFDKIIEKDETKKEEEAQLVRGEVEEWLYKEAKIEQVVSDNVPQDIEDVTNNENDTQTEENIVNPNDDTQEEDS